jgi:hypothetical protein
MANTQWSNDSQVTAGGSGPEFTGIMPSLVGSYLNLNIHWEWPGVPGAAGYEFEYWDVSAPGSVHYQMLNAFGRDIDFNEQTASTVPFVVGNTYRARVRGIN